MQTQPAGQVPGLVPPPCHNTVNSGILHCAMLDFIILRCANIRIMLDIRILHRQYRQFSDVGIFNDCEKPVAAKDEECEGKALARQTQAEEK